MAEEKSAGEVPQERDKLSRGQAEMAQWAEAAEAELTELVQASWPPPGRGEPRLIRCLQADALHGRW